MLKFQVASGTGASVGGAGFLGQGWLDRSVAGGGLLRKTRPCWIGGVQSWAELLKVEFSDPGELASL